LTPEPRTHCPQLADPFRNLPSPVTTGCTYANNVQVQTVTEQWVINSKAGENTQAHMTVDLSKVPVLPSHPGAQGSTAWSSAASIDSFRFDPHEFSNPTPFFIRKIKIASLERTASGLITFRWNYTKAAGTVDLYREAVAGSTKSFNGTKINAAAIQATTGSYTWDSTGTPDGEYWVYAIFTDGTNQNQVYAPTPFIVDANNIAVPQIVLNRTALTFGALGPIRTPAQTVRLSFTGTGMQCWTASSNHPGVTISPSSGNGAANLQVSIANGTFPGGTTNVLVTIATCQMSSTNSRAIAVTINAMNASAPPSGSFDTPTDGSSVTGSIGVTGWAVDDVGVGRITICRDKVGSESAPANGNCSGAGQIYIGDGTFVDDARPDIEAASATPASYKAGWGYLMLTNFLPAQGNGTFKIYAYAYDVEGNVKLLGSKTIVAVNASATKPFGAIDTPGQGAVVCGTILNFGWVLTQKPKTIPANSSTVAVYIDGVAVGQPTPLDTRADIVSLFPAATYNDPTHSVGAFGLDTTLYSNGSHSIFWLVTDSAGQQDGIGSRFFTIANPCSGS